jgi:hypothetical protein
MSNSYGEETVGVCVYESVSPRAHAIAFDWRREWLPQTGACKVTDIIINQSEPVKDS